MAEDKNNQLFQNSIWNNYGSNHHNHMIKNNDHNYEKCTSSSTSSSMVSSGSDTTDDDATSSSNSSGSLYDLSDIMAQLPIKRGLSKFYNGKSDSFASLSRVTSIEDLAKKTTPFRKKLKVSKSYGTGLSSYKNYTLPKAIISKKTSARGSVLSCQTKRGGCMSNGTLPSLQKNLEC